MGPDTLAQYLKGTSPRGCGPEHSVQLLQMYNQYVELADNISGRREKVNLICLTVNAVIVALLARQAIGGQPAVPRYLEILVPIAAGVLCLLWYRIVRSYRDLNSAKLKVIHAIERNLQICPYDTEWEALGRGKNEQRHLPFTDAAIAVPWLFMGFHGILVLAAIPWSHISAFLGFSG
jgi:hypothetical protein